MNIDTLLNAEIESEFEKLKDIKVGTDEYKTTVDGLVKLTDRAIEIEKLNVQAEEKEKARQEEQARVEFEQNLKQEQFEQTKAQAEDEAELKLKQMEEDRKDRFIKNCISVAGIVLPVVVTIWGTKKSFEFEKEGTITTIMGRGFINKLLPKK